MRWRPRRVRLDLKRGPRSIGSKLDQRIAAIGLDLPRRCSVSQPLVNGLLVVGECTKGRWIMQSASNRSSLSALSSPLQAIVDRLKSERDTIGDWFSEAIYEALVRLIKKGEE